MANHLPTATIRAVFQTMEGEPLHSVFINVGAGDARDPLALAKLAAAALEVGGEETPEGALFIEEELVADKRSATSALVNARDVFLAALADAARFEVDEDGEYDPATHRARDMSRIHITWFPVDLGNICDALGIPFTTAQALKAHLNEPVAPPPSERQLIAEEVTADDPPDEVEETEEVAAARAELNGEEPEDEDEHD